METFDEERFPECHQPFDGKGLFELIRINKAPGPFIWDIEELISEVEKYHGGPVIDIPIVKYGASNFGIYMQLTDSAREVVARLSRSDAEYSLQQQVSDIHFEAAVNGLLLGSQVPVSKILYSRLPQPRARNSVLGRGLIVFEKNDGDNDTVWGRFDTKQLLNCVAEVRANLFKIKLSEQFLASCLTKRLHEIHGVDLTDTPDTLPRQFCMNLFTEKVKAVVKLAPIDSHQKRTIMLILLSAIPHILPPDTDGHLYRLVLEHRDFKMDNLLITRCPEYGEPEVTALFDWEQGCVLPAILSDPSFITPNLSEKGGSPARLGSWDDLDLLFTGVSSDNTVFTRLYGETGDAKRLRLGKYYLDALFRYSPEYADVMATGEDARHFWSELEECLNEDNDGINVGDILEGLAVWARDRAEYLGD
ncbi:hypothetical protein B0T24DRAFT_643385 [Lasiosphaeria ovina]|uniref:Aminoglycoside phosphotransferase domain-containing protein n=1 Tax=Lasiosphaeria ovina TaxID=92902 RepID=A0AAE0JSM2_9PEZI|nr:hypothetical protein B0T24DRAFT_643385 [Lasiosphaeria ovina]